MDMTLSPAQALVTIFTEPRRVFDSIPRRSMAYLPLLLALAGHVAIWVWYYQVVDIAWLLNTPRSRTAPRGKQRPRCCRAAGCWPCRWPVRW